MFVVVAVFAGILITGAVRRRQSLSPGLVVTIAMGLTLAMRVVMEIRVALYAIYSSSILFLVFVIVLWRVVDWVNANAQPRARAFSVVAYFAIYGLVFTLMASSLYPGLPWPLIHTPVGDVRRTPEHLALVTKFLPVLQQAKGRGERVLLLPELTGLYFIAGMQSPSRYEVLTPGVLSPGKFTDIFLRELASNPPDLIVLSNRQTSEYGANYFGLDYDQRVSEWIDSRYRVTGEIGHFQRGGGAPLAALIYQPKN